MLNRGSYIQSLKANRMEGAKKQGQLDSRLEMINIMLEGAPNKSINYAHTAPDARN